MGSKGGVFAAILVFGGAAALGGCLLAGLLGDIAVNIAHGYYGGIFARLAGLSFYRCCLVAGEKTRLFKIIVQRRGITRFAQGKNGFAPIALERLFWNIPHFRIAFGPIFWFLVRQGGQLAS